MTAFAPTATYPTAALPIAATEPPPETGPMTFIRSKTRTIEVLPSAIPFGATTPGFWNIANPKKPVGVKDPNANIDIAFDWTKFLADITDEVATHAILLTGGLLSLGSYENEPDIVTVFLSGGEVDAAATVTCRITTASTPPRVIDRTVTLNIEEQ